MSKNEWKVGWNLRKRDQGSHSLEKSLNFRGSSWKVLEFSLTLIIVAWKELFDAFWLSKAEYKSKLREFKGYLHKVLYVLCNK